MIPKKKLVNTFFMGLCVTEIVTVDKNLYSLRHQVNKSRGRAVTASLLSPRSIIRQCVQSLIARQTAGRTWRNTLGWLKYRSRFHGIRVG